MADNSRRLVLFTNRPFDMFLHIFIIYICLKNCFALSNHPLVLVVSYDAFRYDYLNKGVTPTLSKLRDEGCTADFLENVVITKTFPNHFTIATGLYPETHGVMGNSLYDPILGRKLEYSYELWHYNERVTPLWIENERRGGGRHSGVMMWPGNEFNYTGRRPTFQQAWTESMPWQKRVDTALSWFQHPTTPANLVMAYFEEPDSHGHAFGPDSMQNLETLRSMDRITQYLIARMEALGLKDKINLFLVSDHGMHTVTKNDVIDLRPYVADDLYDRYETSPTLHIYPKKGKAVEVYQGLMRAAATTKGFRVFTPTTVPQNWHYGNNRRMPPLLLVADPPYVFHDFYDTANFFAKKYNFTANNSSTFGVHGYDNMVPSMRPYFIATGPAIRNKTRVKPFRTVDLFGIWADVLGFPDAVKATNGSSDPAKAVLNHHHVSVASIAAGILGCILVLGAMAVTVYFVHRKLQFKYQQLLQTDDLDDEDSRQRLLDNEEA